MEITIVPYSKAYREGCMAAFLSNVPKFFATEEIAQFGTWLDHMEGATIEYPDSESLYFVVLHNQEVIGCGGFGYSEATKKAVLAWGLVHSEYHKKNIGRKLLEFRLERIASLYPGATLWLDTTQHSYPFFEKFGFTIQQFTEDGYAKGMHRYDMIWKINSNSASKQV
ncbi:GNAT family N-acetyltransferase [Pseudoflavitalea sp. G-6-1-2]|uniref:GNAT family N-acetyltransferase n=1 Tax=Pseudoflavitalea sp. G-6-1-2 TaxID=2728841 RepID=UPI00146D2AE6|nr:GNAT family N-acetyltransferase [Pseudoflavitalea sp. G-6-1-2]NML20000.1 GNAT family N-acetyltransferase [Pseudoflavitalea sp. G-6-1-2]